MSVCTFFGHRDCYGLDPAALRRTLEDLITNGTDLFYLGNQGGFDFSVLATLKQLKTTYPHIRYCVVLAYLPTRKQEYAPWTDCGMFPEGLEEVHPKFAIDRRNRWMISRADICVCYVSHPWGGAYQYSKIAKGNHLTIINLGTTQL